MDEGLVDAVEAFFDAGKSGKYEEAAQAFKDMQSLSCDAEEEEDGEDEGKMGENRGKPLNLLIGLVKKK